jgi:hypothetical protein
MLLKGCYVFPNVQDAQYKRLEATRKPLWVKAMAAQILRHKSKFFRWHDSGDIQSLKHLAKIFEVARLRPMLITGYLHGKPGSNHM